MNSPRALRAALGAALALTCLAMFAPSAGARTVWVCHPDKVKDPCDGSLTATQVRADGSLGRVERTRINRRAPVDCFYVYPTVSDQPPPNADRRADAQVRAIALHQASRFSQNCKVYAPVYRQLTLGAIGNPGSVTAAARERAYGDVRAAWRDYLRRDNKGRGVVLIGHSQGTFMLRELIRDEIDGKPSVRRRLVSALLTGGNVTVRKGQDVGGDFRRVRACRSPSQTACVVAYSIFGDEPPADARFGQVGEADRDRLEVLCTNPAALRGGRGTLDGYVATKPFPGTIGVGIRIQGGELPDVRTPWLHQVKSYRAACERTGNVNVLRATAVGGARDLVPVPDPTWGWHLADVNLAFGNLTDLVRSQSRAYLRAR